MREVVGFAGVHRLHISQVFPTSCVGRPAGPLARADFARAGVQDLRLFDSLRTNPHHIQPLRVHRPPTHSADAKPPAICEYAPEGDLWKPYSAVFRMNYAAWFNGSVLP